MMNAQKAYPSQNSHGTIIQTLDVLDFSSVDLSSLERLQRRHRLRLRASAGKQGIDPIQAVIDASALLRERALSKRTPYTHYSNRTIVIIPFLGSDRPNGNSLLANRMHYLRACFLEHISRVSAYRRSRQGLERRTCEGFSHRTAFHGGSADRGSTEVGSFVCRRSSASKSATKGWTMELRLYLFQ
jgi:hypothetical protein